MDAPTRGRPAAPIRSPRATKGARHDLYHTGDRTKGDDTAPLQRITDCHLSLRRQILRQTLSYFQQAPSCCLITLQIDATFDNVSIVASVS